MSALSATLAKLGSLLTIDSSNRILLPATPPQYDNSKLAAPTAFVFRALQSLIQRTQTKSAAYTVTAADAGTMFYCTASMTFTLPDAAAATGLGFGFMNNNTMTMTVTTASSSQWILGENFGAATWSTAKQNATIWVFSDGGNWILLSSSPATTAPNVAPVRNSVGGTWSASYSNQTTATFTAPRSGYVVGVANFNLASTANLAGSIQVSLYINGTLASGDSTLVSQSHTGLGTLTKGQACTVQAVATANSSFTTSTAADLIVGAFFLPG